MNRWILGLTVAVFLLVAGTFYAGMKIGRGGTLWKEMPPSRATLRAKASSASSSLQTVRSQSELYRLQHGDRWPDLLKEQWRPFLNTSQYGGQAFGPYLTGAMVNPFNGTGNIVPAGQASSTDGWTVSLNGTADQSWMVIRIVLPADVDPATVPYIANDYERPSR